MCANRGARRLLWRASAHRLSCRSISVTCLPGQNVGVTQVRDHIWLVTFMHYDLGYFDDENCRLEPIENPFGPKVLGLGSDAAAALTKPLAKRAPIAP